MLLVADIGNTTVSFGVFSKQELVARFSLPTAAGGAGSRGVEGDGRGATFTTELSSTELFSTELLSSELSVVAIDPSKINAAVVGSVAPSQTPAVRSAIKSLARTEPVVLASIDDLIAARIPLVVKAAEPNRIGIDRLLNVFAAKTLYQVPAVVVDFGTATTFSVVNHSGEFIGGAISPGLNLAFTSLTSRAELLSEIELRKPEAAIGRSTAEALRSGFIFGFAGMVEGLLARIIDELDRDQRVGAEISGQSSHKPIVIATGGSMPMLRDNIRGIDIGRDDLTLQGLRLVGERV